MDNRGLIPGSCHHVQTRSGGPPSLLSNGYWGLFPWG